MDYKERFIALINEMHDNKHGGLIPMVIAEGLRESKAYNAEDPHGSIIYWTISHLYKK